MLTGNLQSINDEAQRLLPDLETVATAYDPDNTEVVTLHKGVYHQKRKNLWRTGNDPQHPVRSVSG